MEAKLVQNTHKTTFLDLDIFDVLKAFWDGKWIIAGTVALAVIGSFIFTSLTPTKYRVMLPFSITTYSLSAVQVCGSNLPCINLHGTNVVKRFSGLDWGLEKEWVAHGQRNTLQQMVEGPKSLEYYQSVAEEISKSSTAVFLKEAKDELAIMERAPQAALLDSETFARSFLFANKVIEALEDGERQAVVFETPRIIETTPSNSIIYGMSVVLGVLFGGFCLLIGMLYNRRKAD
jgi:hypothetical protein